MSETPTQEVERFRYAHEALVPMAKGTKPLPDDLIRFEDHQRLLRAEEEKAETFREAWKLRQAQLQAEVEKREEAEQDRRDAYLYSTAHMQEMEGALRAAESKLEEVTQELERKASEKVNARDESRGDGSPHGLKKTARLDGEAYGLRAAAQLLRDKGTDPGLDMEDFSPGSWDSDKPAISPQNEAADGTGGRQAFEGEWNYTFVARDLDDASAQWDKLDDYAESLGFNGEGGSVHRLTDDELIPDSPTANKLHGLQGERGEG